MGVLNGVCRAFWLVGLLGIAETAAAQSVTGTVRDETGGALPGVNVEVHGSSAATSTVTDSVGAFRLNVGTGTFDIDFSLVNFAPVKRSVVAAAGANPASLNIVLHLALNADVTVVGKRTFTNLADADRPAENLVGIAQSASQGAITSRRIQRRKRPDSCARCVASSFSTSVGDRQRRFAPAMKAAMKA